VPPGLQSVAAVSARSKQMMSREQLIEQLASARIHQQRADSALESWGMRAKAPVLGQDIDDYRCDLAIQSKRILPESNKYAQIQYRRLMRNSRLGFDNVEKELYAEVAKLGHSNDSVPEGQLRMVESRTDNGMTVRSFLGRNFIHDLKAPVRRVVSITDQNTGHRYKFIRGGGMWF
jgi:hypothetical protein